MVVGSDLDTAGYYADQGSSSSWTATSIPSPSGPAYRNDGETFSYLPGVSCSSSNFCAAVGSAMSSDLSPPGGVPAADVWSGGTWSLQFPPPVILQGRQMGRLSAVSCPADGTCVAAGTVDTSAGPWGLVETLANGTWSSTTVSPQPPGPQQPGTLQDLSLAGVSCPDVSTCFAVGSGGFYEDPNNGPPLLSLSSGAWTSQPLPLPSGWIGGQLSSISCPETSLCMAVGDGLSSPSTPNQPLVEVLSNGTWTASTLPPGSGEGPLTAVSCAPSAVLDCVAVDGTTSKVDTFVGAGWTTQTLPAPQGQSTFDLIGASCPSSGSCTVEGVVSISGTSDGLYEASEAAGAWSEKQLPYQPAPNAGLSAVSCPSSNQCLATGFYETTLGVPGSASEKLTNGQWSPAAIPLFAGHSPSTSGLSCPAASWCVGLGSYADSNGPRIFAEIYSSGSWAAEALPTPMGSGIGASGTSMNAIACPAVGSCIATGYFVSATGQPQGIVEELTNGAWSYSMIGSAGGSSVDPDAIACPVIGWCVAAGTSFESGQSDVPTVEVGWPGHWAAAYPAGNPSGSLLQGFAAVSCPGVDVCVATGSYAPVGQQLVAYRLTGGAWSNISPPPPAQSDPAVGSFGTGVSCLSTSACVTTGQFQNGAPIQPMVLGPTGWQSVSAGSPPWHDASTLSAVSCAQDGICELVGRELPTVGNETPLLVTVDLAGVPSTTTTYAAATPNSPDAGQPVVYRASVVPAPDGGEVTFLDQTSGQILCRTALSNGSGSCGAIAGSTGRHTIVAAYSGDPRYQPSSTAIAETVQPPPCPVGVNHPAGGQPWAVAAVVTNIDGRLCDGYWVATRTGGVIAVGGARWLGDLTGSRLAAPVIGIAATPDGRGYYLVAADGGVFTFGDAHFEGSAGSVRLAAPVVAIAPTPTGGGYWLVAADGGVFTYGDARFHGSTGGIRLAKPVVGMASDPATGGYWLAASDGGVFSFDAEFHGSEAGVHLAQPVVGITAQPDGGGYRLVAGDGGVFDFGDATFYGSLPAEHVISAQVTTMSRSVDGRGYYLVNGSGDVWGFGDATFVGDA